MQKKQLLSYIHHPGKMDRESLEKLQRIREQYPYFTTARLLLIRNLYLLNDAAFQQEVEDTAPHVADRRVLYELIHPLSESEINAPEEDTMTVEPEITVASERSEPVAEIIPETSEPVPVATEEEHPLIELEAEPLQSLTEPPVPTQVLSSLEEIGSPCARC